MKVSNGAERKPALQRGCVKTEFFRRRPSPPRVVKALFPIFETLNASGTVDADRKLTVGQY